MDVLIAGGHGRIARRLIRILAADGHTARGLIRNPDHAADLEADGGIAVLCDLEREDRRAARRAAPTRSSSPRAPGPGSGPERKRTVDLGAAVKCVEAAEARGVARFLMVSSIGAHDPDGGVEAMRPYLRAKAEADARLAASTLDWTIVRPGSLQDEPGTRPRRPLDRSSAAAVRSRGRTSRACSRSCCDRRRLRGPPSCSPATSPVDEAVRALESTLPPSV